MSNEEKDYEVGYGKPPEASRFKKGESGNRKGRPKGARGLETDLKAELNEVVSVNVNGKKKKFTKQQLMLKQLVGKAVKGDLRAIEKSFGLVASILGVEDEAPKGQASLSMADEGILKDYLARRGLEEKINDG